MEIVSLATGEVIDVAAVRASVARVCGHVESIWVEWVWQVENETWQVLGYESWDEMRAAEYGHLSGIAAPRQDRPDLVARFRRAGLTQKQTSETLGVSDRTVRNEEPDDMRGSRGPEKTGNFSGFQDDVVDAEMVEEEPRSEPPVWVVPDAAWEPSPTRDGATDWSRKVQNITAGLPIEGLTDNELAELLGAVEHLHNYIKGERVIRVKGMK